MSPKTAVVPELRRSWIWTVLTVEEPLKLKPIPLGHQISSWQSRLMTFALATGMLTSPGSRCAHPLAACVRRLWRERPLDVPQLL